MNKYQQALEIIKNKPRLDLVYVRDSEDYNDYVMTLNIASYGLENEDVLIFATQKEYDLLKEVLFNEKTKANRKYVAYFKKYYIYNNGSKYQDNAHFCISALDTDAIKRPFENDNIVVEELKVTERLTGKVIYQGTSYEEYLKVIRGLKQWKQLRLY